MKILTCPPPSVGTRPKGIHTPISHGMSNTKVYKAWISMNQRCSNEKFKHFKNYGARGIKVCDRWLAFENFWEDMKDGYIHGLTLDRIDNDKGYYKENCRWTTRSINNRNKRTNRIIDSPLGKMCLVALEEKYGLRKGHLSGKFRDGKTEAEVYEYLKNKQIKEDASNG